MIESSRAPLPPIRTPSPEHERFRRLITSMEREWVTYALVAVNVLVFAVMVASGVSLISPTPEQAMRWGASSADTTTTGDFWRLYTSNYVHYGVLHIGFNMYVLWRAGPMIERVFGHLGFFIGYAFAGFVGSVVSALFDGLMYALYDDPIVASAGASGAIFGIFGMLGAFILRRRRAMPRELVIALRGTVISFIVFNVLFAFAVRGLDQAAHLGGLLGGFLAGLVLTPALEDDGPRRPYALYPIPVAIMAIVTILFALSIFALA